MGEGRETRLDAQLANKLPRRDLVSSTSQLRLRHSFMTCTSTCTTIFILPTVEVRLVFRMVRVSPVVDEEAAGTAGSRGGGGLGAHDLLDKAEEDGDDDDGFEGLAEDDEEDGDGEE